MQILQQNYTRERSEQETAQIITTELLTVKSDIQDLRKDIAKLVKISAPEPDTALKPGQPVTREIDDQVSNLMQQLGAKKKKP
jgi:uncharacterized protein (UPF0254 family)